MSRRLKAMPERRPTCIVKHSVVVAGHRTSISLEDAFWSALKGLANKRRLSLGGLVACIDAERGDANLSSAIRVYVLQAAGDPTSAEPPQ